MLIKYVMRSIIRYIRFFCFLMTCLTATAQGEDLRITARYTESEISVDGVMDEAIWQGAEPIGDFWQFFPIDSLRSVNQTEVRILYNDETIYVGIVAGVVDDQYVVSSLRRDFPGTQNDNISLMFDTFSDGQNAFMFGVSPYGVQREALITLGGTREGFNPTWDMKWRAESKMYKDRYVVEMAIPFTSLKFEEGVQSWRLQVYRWDFQTNEQSAWARVPQNQLLSNIAFAGELRFEKPLGKSRTPFAIIPYVNAMADQNPVSDQSNQELLLGADAKVAIGDGLNLDLTINPDFSNVEVDAIFTNLTRFEILLPERRQFFIDNSDLFASFGDYFAREARPFFSRRIGLARDTAGNLIQNQILGGLRLSGKVNENWRLGVMDIQTAADESNEIAANNNMMLALQRKVMSRSTIGGFFINRQTVGEYEFLTPNEAYNRVVGIDYNLSSADNVWNGKAFFHKSFNPDDKQGNQAGQATLIYNTRDWNVVMDWLYVDEQFQSDLGFVPRTDILKSGFGLTRRFYPNNQLVNTHSIRYLSLLFWRPGLNFQNTDRLFQFSWETNFKNQSTVSANVSNNYIFLTQDFDPTRSGEGSALPGMNGYTFNQTSISFESNPANVFNYGVGASAGEFFNGNSYSYNATANLRMQPWANIGLIVRYDQIRLPNPYPDADLWLVTPRLDVTFSKKLFWSTLLQYSNQRNNIGINSRLQWRYAPLSDLFIVYNDNYIPEGLLPQFRSINLKLTYWFNPKLR